MQPIHTLAVSTDALAQQLENYLHSHAEDCCKLLGWPAGTSLCVEITGPDIPINTHYNSNRGRLRIGEDDGQRVLAYARSCNWANGIVLIPTLTQLCMAGAFTGLQAGQPRSMLSLATAHKIDPTRNLGLLWGALNLLSLAGWVTLSSGDTQAHYALTDAGVCVVHCVAVQHALFTQLAEAASMLQHLHALCHGRYVNAAHSELYEELVQISCAGWPLPSATTPLEQRSQVQLRTALDGFLLGPTWVALDMPVFEQLEQRHSQVADSIFTRFDQQSGGISIATGWPHANVAVLSAAWKLMKKAGMVDIDRNGECVHLNRMGSLHRPIAAPYAGLPASYLRSYAKLDEYLFGDPDPLGVERDGHIDRVMNIYASSGAGSGPASREITTKIIRYLFDELPLDQQPAGLADMGCGDGSALRGLAQYVLQSTRRAQHLSDYPLLIVGADYNALALSRAADTLSDLGSVAGVHVRVLQADISQPDAYDRAVACSGLIVKDSDGTTRPARLNDLLHTFMFLIHNRRLVVRQRAAAEAILQRYLCCVHRPQLRSIVEQYFPGQMTVSDHELLPIPLDQIKAAFRVAYSDEEGLVPGYVAAADLVDFIARWKPYIKYGFLVVEGHTPWAENLHQETPVHPERWARTEQLPAVFNWGMHFVSRQFMMPFNEFMLAMCLAGLGPRENIYGRIYPEGFPGLDLLSEYRFFSISDYVVVPQ